MQVKAAWVWWPAGHSSWREIETQNFQSKRDPYARWRRLKETPMPTFGPHRCTCTSTCTHELPHRNMYTHQASHRHTHTCTHVLSPHHHTNTEKKNQKSCFCPFSCDSSFVDIPDQAALWGAQFDGIGYTHKHRLWHSGTANCSAAPLTTTLTSWQPCLRSLSQNCGALGTTRKCCPAVILFPGGCFQSGKRPLLPRSVLCV